MGYHVTVATKGVVMLKDQTNELLAMARYSYQQEKDRSVELRSLAMGLLTVAALFSIGLTVSVPRVLGCFDAYRNLALRIALVVTAVAIFAFAATSAILSIVALMQIGHDTLATPQELRARASVAEIDDSEESQRTFMHDLAGMLQAPYDALCARNFAIANLVRTSESFMIAAFGVTLAAAIAYLIVWLVF